MVKKAVIAMMAFAFCIAAGSFVFAIEHGGTTTQEHGGKAQVKVPAAGDIRAAMKSYVDAKSQATGSFDVMDPETGKVRKLKLDRVHERVGKTGNYYYSCADFTDIDSGEKLDLDLDVENKDGGLNVVDVRIHKVNAKERYTYDEHDNRIPVSVVKEETGKEHAGK